MNDQMDVADILSMLPEGGLFALLDRLIAESMGDFAEGN
jgi:hypothetical protein